MANKLKSIGAASAILALQVCAYARTAPVIAIDVGHSLQSPGATSARGKTEFEFNRDLAKVVWQTISARHVKAFEIGADGNSVDPETRPVDASSGGASFFLSIHHDSAQPQYLEEWTWEGSLQHYTDRFSGFSLFVSRKNKQLPASLKCASAIGVALKQSGLKPSMHHAEKIEGENRAWADQANGVMYQDNLIVLKNAKMPAVLLETGVIVNRDEEVRLLEPALRARIATAISSGLQSCGMFQ
jgi:N-acetylmuramoyl-L-alanine amidase